MIRSWTARGWVAVLAAACASGCGSSSTVSGEVRYDGQPVQDGMITFLPADGKGPSVGGPITHGRYTVAGSPRSGTGPTAPRTVECTLPGRRGGRGRRPPRNGQPHGPRPAGWQSQAKPTASSWVGPWRPSPRLAPRRRGW
jgi:hypothetical protein